MSNNGYDGSKHTSEKGHVENDSQSPVKERNETTNNHLRNREHINHIPKERNNAANPSLLGMIWNPIEQFKRIRQRPKLLVAIIVVTLLTLFASLFTIGDIEAMLADDLVGLSADEMLIFTVVTQITVVIASLFAPVIVMLITASIYMLIAKATSRTVPFKTLFSMVAYIMVITVIGSLVNVTIGSFITGYQLDIPLTSVNIFVGAEGVTGLLLSSIEIFAIWQIVLSAIGLQIVARFSRGLAWTVVIVINVIVISISMMAMVIEQSMSL